MANGVQSHLAHSAIHENRNSARRFDSSRNSLGHLWPLYRMYVPYIVSTDPSLVPRTPTATHLGSCTHSDLLSSPVQLAAFIRNMQNGTHVCLAEHAPNSRWATRESARPSLLRARRQPIYRSISHGVCIVARRRWSSSAADEIPTGPWSP